MKKPIRVIKSQNIPYFETRCETLVKEGYKISHTFCTPEINIATLVLQEVQQKSIELVDPPKKKSKPNRPYIEKINKEKIDLLHTILSKARLLGTFHEITKAEKDVTTFDLETIIIGEDAFSNAIRRCPEKNTIAYLFGTLVSIQKNRAYKHFYSPHNDFYTD